MAELRGGRPVIIKACAPLLVLSAEAASPSGIDDLLDNTGKRTLVVASGRAAFMARGDAEPSTARAFEAPDSLFEPQALSALSDAEPSSPPFRPASPPEGSDAAISLARLARLIPTLIVGAADRSLDDFVEVEAASIMAFTAGGGSSARLRLVAETPMPLAAAPTARMLAFRSDVDAAEHLAVVVGDVRAAGPPLVRIHSKCLTGDLFGSMRCDCGPQLHEAGRLIFESGAGVLLYLDQEGRGIGLVNKLRAYRLQDLGLDTLDANIALGYEPDDRSFEPAAAMLRLLGVERLRLLTNNPAKIFALRALGFDVASRTPLIAPATPQNAGYLETKRLRFGHLLSG